MHGIDIVCVCVFFPVCWSVRIKRKFLGTNIETWAVKCVNNRQKFSIASSYILGDDKLFSFFKELLVIFILFLHLLYFKDDYHRYLNEFRACILYIMIRGTCVHRHTHARTSHKYMHTILAKTAFHITMYKWRGCGKFSTMLIARLSYAYGLSILHIGWGYVFFFVLSLLLLKKRPFQWE